jgi:hypothetical protein
MKNLSRRNLLIGAIAAPGALQIPLPAIAAIPLAANSDELVVRAAEWIAADDHITAMELEWQDLESDLFDKAKRMRMSCAKARQSDLPEAQAMRALDIEIEKTHRRLEALAGEIRLLPATTIAGAIAKIELGLKVQGPYEWRDHAYELIEDGILELRTVRDHG